MIGSYCFVVFSEQLPPRRFAVSTLCQSLLTSADKDTFVELAGHLGVVLTPSHAQMVSESLKTGCEWPFIDNVRTSPYLHKSRNLPKHLNSRYVDSSLQYAFPEKILYQVGTDRRVLMCYSIRENWTDSTKQVELDALLSVDEPITYVCDAYSIGVDGRLHVSVPNKARQKFVFDENEFPSL